VKSGTLNDLRAALRILTGARAPLILVGAGARDATPGLEVIASRLGAAVMTTPDAVSVYDQTSRYAAGVCSFGACARARAIARASDVVLAVGTNIGEFGGRGGAAFEQATVIQVTDDPADLCIRRPAAVSLVADLGSAVSQLAAALRADGPRNPWFEDLPRPAETLPRERAPGRGIDPKAAIVAIAEALPPESRLACDVTTAALLLLHDRPLHPKTSVWLQIERSACMGMALATGLGIRKASGVPTLVLLGDWGLTMASAELHTVATLGLGAFVIVAWANGGGLLIRNGVRRQGLEVPDDLHTWPSPNFARVAEGFGLHGVTAGTASALRGAVAEAMGASFPVLVHAVIDPEGPIPGAEDRYETLKAASPGAA
jgi:thiamine pyrophosphate-dependent acetolactate synthase large subunit-like protein